MANNKQKKQGLLLLIPVIAFPFLAIAFWTLGGGGPKQPDDTHIKGLNAELPAARPSGDSALDKMGFYDEADKMQKDLVTDSAGMDSSASRRFDLEDRLLNNAASDSYVDYPGREYSSSSIERSTSKEEKQIQERLQHLQQQLRDQEKGYTSNERLPASDGRIEALPSDQVVVQNPAGEDSIDPEMQQLETMMNRIYDIQHPEEVANRLQAQSATNRGVVYPVELSPQQTSIHFIGKRDSTGNVLDVVKRTEQGFYGLADPYKQVLESDKGIEAIIQENKTIVNGASIRMRLLQDVYINGLRVPKGNFISGVGQLNNDRLLINLTSILYKQSVLPIQLSGYDTDGLEGLYVPGSIRSEVLQQSGDNVLQGTGITTLNPSVEAQAAAAGIETAKTLFSRKLKLVKVFIKAGHRVVLKNQHSTN